jgi:D-inositol-3-phosphate glycosyltransferase
MYKIAFISEHASPLASLGGTDSGGQNVYVSELALQLAEMGYLIDVFTRREDVDIPTVVEVRSGLRVIHIDAGPAIPVIKENLLPFMEQFQNEMISFTIRQNENYHLIHANFWMSGLVAMGIKRLLGIPFVITFHALGHVRKIHQKENDKFPAQRVYIEEEIARNADRIISECPQDQQDLLNHYLADPAKIAMVPCGFNPTEFYPLDQVGARAFLNIDGDEKIVLQLGRIVPRKGIDNVIRAMAILKEQGVKVKLIVVGGESPQVGAKGSQELIRLQKLASELGVTETVNFAGRQDRALLKQYYNAADIFVTTPWYEPFGITPLEAMACGTPVIGADVGGIKFTVLEGKTGLLVIPDQPRMLSDRIALLLDNQKLRTDMGNNALQHVTLNFTWHKVALQLLQVYHEILQPVNTAVVPLVFNERGYGS